MIVCFIPARMGSSRFPGKPLANILGLPMIEWVRRGCRDAKLINDVVVATCDLEIKKTVESFGGKVIMTSTKHERASDRCAEALAIYENQNNVVCDIALMVQGDEPMVTGDMIDQSLAPMLAEPEVQVVNLMSQIETDTEFRCEATIKVVVNNQDDALYFSRRPIPIGDFSTVAPWKQVCVIPFRRDMLFTYCRLEESHLEKRESIDMLRLLENGYTVRMVRTTESTHAVDIPSDRDTVSRLLALKSSQ